MSDQKNYLEEAIQLGFGTINPKAADQALEQFKNLSPQAKEAFIFQMVEEQSNTLKEVANLVGSVLIGLGVKDFSNVKFVKNVFNELPKIAKEKMLFPARFDRRFAGLDAFAPMLKKYAHLMPKPDGK